jgi:1,4-alpha-glucan branching enzyme
MTGAAMPIGYLTLVLHSHLPYLREAGRRSQGEEMLHEAVVETYLPLLNTFYSLRAEGHPFRLTVGMTPIMAEQLADDDVLDRVERALLERQRRAQDDARRFEKARRKAGKDSSAAHFLYLARFYGDWYENLAKAFREPFRRDPLGAFRLLQDEGQIEIVTSAATHAYLPLLARDSTIYAQLRTGVTSYLRHLGRLPRGAWLPECGYRPAQRSLQAGREIARPGLEEFLAELNLGYTFADTSAVVHGSPTPLPAGYQDSSYDAPNDSEMAARPAGGPTASPQRTTFRPYLVQASNVAVYGRDNLTGRQVWSALEGYPGDFGYREFSRQDEESGLRYWRVTGDVPPEAKDLYDPYDAFHRVQEHAAHFVEVVRGLLRGYHERTGRPGIVVAAYDAGLLGHWWFEGPAWLRDVLTRLGRDPEIGLTTAGEYLALFPPQEATDLRESSWGKGGDHSTWSNPSVGWMWPLIHEAEHRMEALVARFPNAEGWQLEVLKQAAREALLLQSSDWPFLVTTRQFPDYAAERFRGHLERFDRLAELAARPELAAEEQVFLQECQHLDNPFLNIDYRVFGAR